MVLWRDKKALKINHKFNYSVFLLHCVIFTIILYSWISLSLPDSENRVWACIGIVL